MDLAGMKIATQTTNNAVSVGEGYGSLDTSDFMQILIAQLSNQNPMEPMENEQLLNQISSITQVETMNDLNETLTTLSTNTNLSTASSMIGKVVSGVGPDGQSISGLAESALVQDGTVYLKVGDWALPVSGVTSVEPPEA